MRNSLLDYAPTTQLTLREHLVVETEAGAHSTLNGCEAFICGAVAKSQQLFAATSRRGDRGGSSPRPGGGGLFELRGPPGGPGGARGPLHAPGQGPLRAVHLPAGAPRLVLHHLVLPARPVPRPLPAGFRGVLRLCLQRDHPGLA